jgi:RHS repeat-associated protein
MGSGATYTFDGNSIRVKKVSGATTTVYIFSGAKVIAEYDNGAAPASPSREYIYSAGALLAKIEAGATMYYHPDHLSNRLLTDSSGNTLGQRGHYPFGETWYESGATTTKIKFTTYERDSESTNDYALARFYSNRFGRFSSSDPLAGSIRNPQSLNHYAYVLNDPLDFVDPLGLFCPGSGCFPPEGQGDLGPDPDPAGNQGRGPKGDYPHSNGGGGSTRYVNPKVLAKCIRDLFGVTTSQFTESVEGTNGSFTGQGPDTLSNGGNNANITVTNDVKSYSGEGLKALRDSRGNPPLPEGTTALAGLTLFDQPYVNYTANNLSQLNQPASMAAETQVHELGNSLHFITGAAFNPATVPGSDKDAGQALENCVRKRGGFNKP